MMSGFRLHLVIGQAPELCNPTRHRGLADVRMSEAGLKTGGYVPEAGSPKPEALKSR
jgi:hypothetical protein